MANKSKLTPGIVADIVQRYADGDKVGDIAKDYGIHRNAVSYYTQRAGRRKKRQKPGNYIIKTINLDADLVEFQERNYPNLSLLVSSLVRHLMIKTQPQN